MGRRLLKAVLISLVIVVICLQAFLWPSILQPSHVSVELRKLLDKQSGQTHSQLPTVHSPSPRELFRAVRELSSTSLPHSTTLGLTTQRLDWRLDSPTTHGLSRHSLASQRSTSTRQGIGSLKRIKQKVIPEKKPRIPYSVNKTQENSNYSLLKKQLLQQMLLSQKLVENDRNLPTLTSDPSPDNILFTVRTTMKYHEKRLPVLFRSWLTTANTRNVYIVTDGHDESVAGRDGTGYVNAGCGSTYTMEGLCCKAGVELSLFFRAGNEQYDWFCHVDDDIYVALGNLARQLGKFSPRSQPVYYGRAGDWGRQHRVGYYSLLGMPGRGFYYAVGGMYCLSRAMMELVQPYLGGGKVFSKSCSATGEPEDVTVGLVVGAVLNQTLSQTELILTHGLILATESSKLWSQHILKDGVGFAYGFSPDGITIDNYILVPHGYYSLVEDPTRFLSLHCYLLPNTRVCQDKLKAKMKHEKKS